jgi:hypothetical protein
LTYRDILLNTGISPYKIYVMMQLKSPEKWQNDMKDRIKNKIIKDIK